MKRTLALAALALLASASLAQISDSEAKSAADSVLRVLGSDAVSKNAKVSRDTIPTKHGSDEIVRVIYGEVTVQFYEDGSLLSFRDLSKNSVTYEPDDEEKYPTDEEAWQAFEEVISKLETPADVGRTGLSRATKNGLPYTMTFVMERAKAFAWPVTGGNRVTAEMDRMSGKIITLHIVSGWTYERRNVSVGAAAAIGVTRKRYGGVHGDWIPSMRYSYPDGNAAGAELAALMTEKKMRLMYVLKSDSATVLVDSVTGKIVDYSQTALQAEAQANAAGAQNGKTEQASSKQAQQGEDASGDGKSGGPSTLLLMMGGVGALLILNICVRLFVKK